ncbi:hypothetical protein ABDD95_07505 [Mucilaginibacter sp. PAMB04274]|uniref:hypothetical protein n=1 Tax=Mucilaginibacter sp. PAMB04274 TaxID=3138568 RepID=UPI0031F6C653
MEDKVKKLTLRLAQLDPELYIRLQDEGRLADYLDSFYAVPDPLAEMASRFGASRYDYVAGVLEEDFLASYLLFSGCGILRYELINLTAACADDFEQHWFPGQEDSRLLRYAVIATIDTFLKGGSPDGI